MFGLNSIFYEGKKIPLDYSNLYINSFIVVREFIFNHRHYTDDDKKNYLKELIDDINAKAKVITDYRELGFNASDKKYFPLGSIFHWLTVRYTSDNQYRIAYRVNADQNKAFFIKIQSQKTLTNLYTLELEESDKRYLT